MMSMPSEQFDAVMDTAASAFTAGCVACASGALRSSNPHAPNTPVWAGWQRGWMHEFKRLPEPLRAARIAREPALGEGKQ